MCLSDKSYVQTRNADLRSTSIGHYPLVLFADFGISNTMGFRMKGFAWVLVLLLSMSVQAADVQLIPVYTPNPVYPIDMWRANKSGKVRVSYWVNADGSVSDLKVLKSSHREFDRAVKRRVKTWRFKPWTPTDQRPAKIKIVAPFEFDLGSGATWASDMNTVLTTVPCSKLNEELAQTRQYFPDKPLPDLHLFGYIRAYLSGVFMRGQLSDGERQIMLDDLDRAVPRILESCERNPTANYVDFLPENMRKLF